MKHFPAFMKKALLALCVAASLPIAATAQDSDGLVGDIKTVVTRYMGMMSENDPYYGSLSISDGYAKFKPIYKGADFANGEEYDLQSSVVRDGILYIPQLFYDELGMIENKPSIRWKRVDLATGKFLTPLTFGLISDEGIAYMMTYSLTYDEVDDKFYGLAYDYFTEAMGILVEIDASLPESQWRAKTLGDVGYSQNNFMAGIVFNPVDRKLYGIKDNGTFNEIDISGSEVKVIDLIQYDDFNEYYCFPLWGYPVAMCYSPYDKAFIFNSLGSDSDQVFRIGAIDAETFEARELGEMDPMAYLAGLFCDDPYAPDQAPDRMKAAVVTFDGPALSGSYSVELPSKTFGKEEISGNLILHVILDGEEIYSGAQTPGTSFTNNLTTTQGLHTLEVYSSLGEFNSPSTRTRFYVGYDLPLTPSNLALKNNLLTWNAPEKGGANNGYIDNDNITYDVYFNGVKHNSAPITKNEYRFFVDAPAARTVITVKAVSNGVSSEASAPLSRMIGKGLELPISLAPTAQEAELFEIYDVDHNGSTNGDMFRYEIANNRHDYPAFAIMSSNYATRVDDWLFLPPVYCDDLNAIYSIIYNYRNVYGAAKIYDDLDICIGTDPTPEAMTTLIYSHTNAEQIELFENTARFTVPTTGTYFIGFHTKPGDLDAYPRWRGIELSNFRVNKDAGSTKAPGAMSDVKIEAAPLGDLSINITATLPTVDLNGDPLPADQVVTLNARSAEYSAKTSGKPGETVTLNLPAGYEGLTTVFVSASSEEGIGPEINKRLYVGTDTPLPPTNIRGVMSEDNCSITLTWDPVSTVGVNGGYVDPNTISYQIYVASGINQNKIGNAGNQTTYTAELGGYKQEYYFVGPVAFNEVGNSTNGSFLGETFGTPHKTPMQEEFGYAAFDYAKWYNNTVAPLNGGSWSHLTDPNGLNIGTPTFQQGGAFQATAAETYPLYNVAELFAPKVSTLGVKNALLKLNYWDYDNAAKIEVWGRTYEDQTPRKIGEINPTHTGDWLECAIPVPAEFGNQSWIQLNLRAVFENATQRAIIDSYAIVQDTDFDYQLTNLTAPFYAFVGDKTTFSATVTNAGAERAAGSITIELLGDGEILNKVSEDISAIAAGASYEFDAEFEMLESYVNYSKIEVRATTTCAEDSNDTNNVVTMEFILKDNSLPVVRDLKAKRHDNGHDAVLEWSAPDTALKNFESFEAIESFGNRETLGRWQNIDVDGKIPFAIGALEWPGYKENGAWTVFDCESMGTMNDARLFPHTGKRLLLARSISYDQDSGEAPSRSAEFLVSPEVKGGSELSFWINTISTQHSETFEVWYSTTGTNLDPETAVYKEASSDGIPGAMISCGDFKRLPSGGIFTKSGSDTWEQMNVTLPKDAKYFAIVYTSFGMFAGMVDDIEFEPAATETYTIDSYDVYASYEGREPLFVGSTETPGFTHVLTYDPAATYYVQTVVKDGNEYFNSAFSNPAFVDGTGVDGIEESSILVGGAKGHVLVGGAEGLELSLYDLDGRLVVKTLIESDRQSVPVAAGFYIARVGETAVKVIVR